MKKNSNEYPSIFGKDKYLNEFRIYSTSSKNLNEYPSLFVKLVKG